MHNLHTYKCMCSYTHTYIQNIGMEYAITSLATASNANKSKLDKVQNVALRAIVGAMKTTPIKEMEKSADLEPPELRRTFKVLT